MKSEKPYVQYWPVATYREGREVKGLFTYNSFLTLAKAREQFGIWANGYNYHLLSAEVTIMITWADGTKERKHLKVF